MKEILIPLNFTTTPTVYDTKQSFSTSDEASGVLTFTTTVDVTGTVASLTIRNASENANRQTVRIERLDVNSSPFSYALKNPLPFGQYEGTILLKKNVTVIASAIFLFGVNSSLSAEVLPDLVKAYSLDELVENVETEVSNLKDAFNLTVSETVKGVNKTESSLQAQENVRYLNEHQRKANELERIANENARIAAELERKDTFDTLVDSEVIEQTVVQEVAEKYQEIEALNAPEMVSFRQQLADIWLNVKKLPPPYVSAIGDGVADDTTAFQSALNLAKNVFAPPAKYIITNLKLNPENALIGHNPATTILIAKNGVSTGVFIEIDRSAYSTILRNLTLRASRTDPLSNGLIYSNNGTSATQDSRHIAEHLVIDGFTTNLKADTYTRGGYFADIKSLGALGTGFDIKGTDNMIVSCLSAGAWYDGFYIIGSNNRITNCKSYLAGKSLTRGAAYRFNGSFTIASNLEAQENKLESFYFYNCNDSVFSGLMADGSGVYAENTFPNLEYNDAEFSNVTVPISILRMHNCKRNVISGVLINARGFNTSLGKAKCGIFSLYPGLDRDNNLSLSISDRSGDDSFSVKLPTNIQNDVMNNYVINGKNILDVPCVMSVNYTAFSYGVDPGVTVNAKTLTATINDSTTTTIMYVPALQKNAKNIVFGFERAESATLNQLQIIADVSIGYYNTSDVRLSKVSSYKAFTDNSASFDVDEIMSAVSDFKSIDSIKMRFRVGAKAVGSGTIHTLKVKNPILFQSLKM